MDYMKIVLDGVADENTSRFLDKYFYREFKKATVQLYDYEEFYNGLIGATDKLISDINSQYYKNQNELLKMKNLAVSGELGYPDIKEGETIADKVKDTVKYVDEELNNITKFNYSVNLFQFTGDRYRGSLYYGRVLEIKQKVTSAYERILQELLKEEASKTKVKETVSFVSTIEEKLIEYGLEGFLEEKGISFSKVIQLIKTRGCEFSICLFHHLDYLEYLKRNYCERQNREELHKLVANFFKIPMRRAKGNINVLTPHSKEKKDVYTSINNRTEVVEWISQNKLGHDNLK